MSEKIIADALGLRSLEDVRKESEGEIVINSPKDDNLPVVAPEPDEEVLADIEAAKDNISDLIDKGKKGLEELLEIAKQTESPRAFEVMSGMMKTLLEANRDLVQMSEKKKFEKSENSSQHATTNVTNNNLILSTSELLKMLKDS